MQRCCSILLACTFIVASTGAQQPTTFSVREALSAPFMNQLTAAPAKSRVAWFVDQEGKRNIWVASPTEQAHAITHYTEDDGQDIDDITWSPDAEAVAYTHGTGPDGGEHPTAANPAHLQGDVKQRVEVATVTGTMRVIGEGHAPLFSAHGRQIYFLRHGQIWFAKLTTSTARSPVETGPMSQRRDMGHPPSTPYDTARTSDPEGAPHLAEMWDTNSQPSTEAKQLVEAHGSAAQLRLSPDGTKLAFTSHRGDHSFIGVFDLAKKSLTYIDPGTGLDHDAAWSPDSKRIAFLRESPVVSELDLRWMPSVPVPWSIRIFDVSSGEGKQVWQADAGTGSLFHEMVAKNQLLWMNDNRIVFPWEKTGWLHLYSLALDAKQAQLLTPGDFEVDNVVTDGKRIVYSSNQLAEGSEDQDRKHLWSIDQTSAMPVLLTSGTALETEPALLSEGKLAYMGASTQLPFEPYFYNPVITNGTNLRMPRCESGKPQGTRCKAFEQMGLVVPVAEPLLAGLSANYAFVITQAVQFPASDDLQIHAQLFLPKDAGPTDKVPTIVFFHGGSRRQMLLGYNPMQYYAQTYEMNQYFADHGYAVLSVNYRSGIGYGMKFRQAQYYGAFGGSEYLDIEGAVRWLKAQPWCDTHRIGAWGGSYGGYLTALALARDSADFAAGVDLHGVHDWSYELDLWKPTSDPAHDTSAAAKVAFDASPMADVNKWKSPVLLMQGDDDRNVLFGQTVRLAAALRAKGVTVEEKIFPDEVHDFLLHRDWITAYELAADFFDRHLKAH